MTLDSILTIAVTSIVTGASNAFGVWVVSRHVIGTIDKKGKKDDRADRQRSS